MTIKEFEIYLVNKLNFKFGEYFHGQAGYEGKWLEPRKLEYDGVDYYVSGKIDGEDDGTLIELKTTWATTKNKIKPVIEKAKIQADIYSWIAGYEGAKIIIKNLANPKLDTIIFITQTNQI